MDILKRDLAPLSQEAWDEIDERAEQVLKNYLSARKALKVNGPKGWDYNSVAEGRLENLNEQEGEVKTGVYKVKPLVEGRITFTLNRWELDNITRGAKDIDFDNLEEAAKKIAAFEENAIYKGIPQGNIQGLSDASIHEKISFGNDAASILDALTSGIITLKQNFENGPYALIAGAEVWKRLYKQSKSYPLIKKVEELLGGKVIYSNFAEGAYLIPYNHDDLELIIGQDFSIGYESHDTKEIKLFITESFTFRVLDEKIIIPYTL